MEMDELRVRLPRYLIEWLRRVAAIRHVSVEDVLTPILNIYYDLWRAAQYDARGIPIRGSSETMVEESTKDRAKPLLLSELFERFKNENPGYRRCMGVVESFVRWAEDRGKGLGNLTERDVEDFLSEHYTDRSVRSSTIRSYRLLLRKFVGYAEEVLRMYKGS